jgi:hypothetical protein
MTPYAHTSTDVFPGLTFGDFGERGLVGPGAGPRACRVPFPRTFPGLHRVIPVGNPRCLPRLLGTGLGGDRRCGSNAVSPPRAGSGPGGSRAEPLLRGHLPGKGRKLEPKSASGRSARQRGGTERETERVALVCARHSSRQFPLHPYSPVQFPLRPYMRSQKGQHDLTTLGLA